MPIVGEDSGARPNFARIRPFLSPNARLADPSEDRPSVARTFPLSSPIASPAEPSDDNPNLARTCPSGPSSEKNGDSSLDRPIRKRTSPAASTISNSSARTTRFFMAPRGSALRERTYTYRRSPERRAQAAISTGGSRREGFDPNRACLEAVGSRRGADTGSARHRHGAVGSHFERIRDVVDEVATRRARIARQREPREGGEREVHGPPDAGFEHPPAPHGDAGGSSDVVYPLGLEQPPDPTLLDVHDPARSELDRRDRICRGANRLVEAQVGADLALKL